MKPVSFKIMVSAQNSYKTNLFNQNFLNKKYI